MRDALTVRGWLGLGLGAAAGVLVLVAGAAVSGLQGIDAELERQRTIVQPRADAAVDLQLAVLHLGIAARAQALAPSGARAEALRAAGRALDAASEVLGAQRRDPDGEAIYAPIPALVAAYRARAQELGAARGAAAATAEAGLRDVREELLPRLDGYVDLQQRKVVESSAAVLRRRDHANALVVAGIAAAVAILAAVAALIGRSVRRPLLHLVERSRRIAAGDYAAAAGPPAARSGGHRNELVELASAFGAMAQALEEREQRIAAQNEELQAQNEELQAQNEEIQAQNEEIQSQREELQRQNDELRASEDALREADRRKDEFLAVLSHELRNPLAPIVNGLAILGRAPPQSDAASRAQQVVGRQVKQLVRLVDDLLDVTRIARGKAELRCVDTDVVAIVRHVAEDHRPLVERAGIRLELALPPAPARILADPERLSQVIANLVHNASKFTPSGGTVRIECAVGPERVSVLVRDDGEGIAPELLKRLFVPFVQADGSLARTRGGLGLGLALVKGIVELHGGTVAATSDGPGRGAAFRVELPLGGVRRSGASAAATTAAGSPPATP